MPEIPVKRAGVRQVIPVIGVADACRALEFYVERLGFQKQYAVGDPATYAVVSRDGQIIHFRNSDEPSSKNDLGLYIWVDGLDSFYEECLQKGVAITEPPTTQSYGMREFSLSDVNGIRVTFAEEAD